MINLIDFEDVLKKECDVRLGPLGKHFTQEELSKELQEAFAFVFPDGKVDQKGTLEIC